MTVLDDLQTVLVNGRFSDLPDRLAPIAAWGGTHYETLQAAITLLAYFEREAELAELFVAAWPRVRDEQRFPRLRNEFAAQATDHLIYRYLANTAQPDPHDAMLQKQLSAFFDIDAEGLARTFAVLRHEDGQDWQVADFPPAAQGEGGRENSREQAQSLAYLLLQFVGYAYVEEQTPYCKSHLLRTLLPDYFALRRTGQLEPRQTLDDIRRGQKPILNLGPRHPLLPDEHTGERFVAKLLHFANPQPYKAAAFTELIPAYHRFLRRKKLVKAERVPQSLVDLGKHIKVRGASAPINPNLK